MGDVLGSKIVEVVLDYCRSKRDWEKWRRRHSANRYSYERWRNECSPTEPCLSKELASLAEERDRLKDWRRTIRQSFEQDFCRLDVKDSPLGVIWKQLADEFIEETAVDYQRTLLGCKEDYEAHIAEEDAARTRWEERLNAEKKHKRPKEVRRFIGEFLKDLAAEPMPGFNQSMRKKYETRIKRSGVPLTEKEKAQLKSKVFDKWLANGQIADRERTKRYARFLKKCDEGYYPNADEWLKRGK